VKIWAKVALLGVVASAVFVALAIAPIAWPGLFSFACKVPPPIGTSGSVSHTYAIIEKSNPGTQPKSHPEPALVCPDPIALSQAISAALTAIAQLLAVLAAGVAAVYLFRQVNAQEGQLERERRRTVPYLDIAYDSGANSKSELDSLPGKLVLRLRLGIRNLRGSTATNVSLTASINGVLSTRSEILATTLPVSEEFAWGMHTFVFAGAPGLDLSEPLRFLERHGPRPITTFRNAWGDGIDPPLRLHLDFTEAGDQAIQTCVLSYKLNNTFETEKRVME
jgi:hypothetical protein